MSKLNIYACSGVEIPRLSVSNRVVSDLENSGWRESETLRKYLGTSKDGGCAEYFLYIFIPDSEVSKYNAVIYKKRKQQIETFKYVRELFVGHNYGTEEDMINVIRSGIEATFGTSVENVLLLVRNGQYKGVGDPITLSVEAIVYIVVAIINLVTSVITGVIAYCQNVNVAKYTAPTVKELEDSTPAATDFTKNTKNKGLLWGAIAGAALLLVGTFKKSN